MSLIKQAKIKELLKAQVRHIFILYVYIWLIMCVTIIYIDIIMNKFRVGMNMYQSSSQDVSFLAYFYRQVSENKVVCPGIFMSPLDNENHSEFLNDS